MGKGTSRIRVALAALALFAFSQTVAYAAVSPTISVRKINDYGRIFFSWPQETRLKASQVGNRITITFDNATTFDPASIASKLAPYVTGAALSADGKTLTLSTNHPYRTRQFVSGNATGVDILGLKEGGDTTAPPLETPVANPTPTPPKETLPKPASKPEPKQEPVAKVAVPKSKPPAPKQVQEVPPLGGMPKPQAKPAPPKPAQQPTPEPVKEVAAVAPAPELVAKEPEPEPTVEPAEPEVAAPAEEPEQTPTEETMAATPEPMQEEVETPLATPAETAETTEEVAAPVEAVEVVEEEEATTEEITAPEIDFSEFVGSTEPQAPATDAEPLEAVAEMEDDSGLPFLVTVRQVPGGVDVFFPWRKRVAAAAFQRHNDIFLVFDAEANLRLDLLSSLLPASVEGVEKLDVPGHTVLRFITDGNIGIAARQNTVGYEWVMNLSQGRRIATNPAQVTSVTEGLRPHVFLPVIQDSNTVEITDPSIGDTILVRPFFSAGAGVYPTRSYPQFTLLESPQGLAVIPHDDTTRISGLRNGIRVAAASHTALSENLPKLSLAELDITAGGGQTTLFPYESWKVEPDEFVEARQDLERKISEAADIRASSLKKKLIELYLGEGLGVEALGVINDLRTKDPFFYDEQKIAAYRGAALFLMNRIPQAAREFQSDVLKGNPELQLWEEAFRVFLEGGRPRFDYLNFDNTYIDKYPPEMRRKLALIAADNYINRKNYARATRIFTRLNEDGIIEPIQQEVDYLLGKIASENGRIAAARALWEPLAEQVDNRFVRARSEYSLVAMLYNNGDIDLDEAIERLDRLRIVWRGDSLEIGLLSQLGQLYIDNLEYLKGLRAWDELTSYYPTSNVSLDAAKNMSQTFNYLFIDDGADEVTPLEALAIFQEFRELIPIGREGDLMVQKLADRLAAVDLLAWSASLLDHQVKFRLEGEARSRVGTRLALLYLLNKEPQKALETLELTSYGRNPKSLDDQRERLTAWAFSEIGQPERAISMLSGDFSEQSKSIRLSVYWKMGDWLNVIAMAEDLLGSRENLTAPLTKTESEYLLRLAIAYAFEGDKRQLAYLRDYYGPLIPEENPNRETLMFITDERGPINPTNFADVTSQISSIEAFMQDYRDQIENAGLSSAFN